MNVENTTLQDELRAWSAPDRDHTARSDGILSPEDVKHCRARGLGLAFDPLQLGWVLDSAEDDLAAKTEDPELIFRHWEEGDAASLAAMLSSPRLWRFLPDSDMGPLSLDEAKQLIDVSRADHHLVLAVTRNEVPVGQVRLLFDGPSEAEISYWIGEAYWGNGFASEVVQRFTRQCLRDRPDLSRLYAVVHKDNPASRRVLEKAGYKAASQKGDWITLDCQRQG